MSASKKKPSKAEKAILAIALEYPDAYEDHPWGDCVAKIKGKVFAFIGQTPAGEVGLSVKLPVTGKEALQLPFTQPTGYGLGKHGWVSGLFPDDQSVPLDLVREWIDESFRAVAPKSVLAKIEAGESCAFEEAGAKEEAATNVQREVGGTLLEEA